MAYLKPELKLRCAFMSKTLKIKKLHVKMHFQLL